MKRLIAFTLALVSIFALCAFGVPATAAAAPAPAAESVITGKTVVFEEDDEVSDIPDEYVQFKEILDALAAGEYDKAQVLIEDLKPKPEMVEVEITKDNFLDYFEYTGDFEPSRYIEKNSKGKTVGFYLCPGYVLKDGYKVVLDREHESKVEVGVKYKVKWYYPVKKNVDVDFDKLTYKVTGKAKQTDTVDEMREGWYSADENGNVNTYFIGFSHSTYMTYKKDYWANAVPKKDVTIVSASGTLYLYADSIPEPAPEPAPEG